MTKGLDNMALNINIEEKTKDVTYFGDIRNGEFFLYDSKVFLKLEELLKSQNILNVYAVIAAPEQEDEYLNFDSIKFHTKMGYTQSAEYKTCGFKFNKWYSVVIMQKFLDEHNSNPKPVIYWNNRKLF